MKVISFNACINPFLKQQLLKLLGENQSEKSLLISDKENLTIEVNSSHVRLETINNVDTVYKEL